MDRRVPFFLGAAAACFALFPVADPSHRVFAVGLGIVYVVLAALIALDARARAGGPSWGTGFAVTDVEGDPDPLNVARPAAPPPRDPTS